MKKIIALLLAVLFAFAFTACAGTDNDATTAAADDTTAADGTTAAADGNVIENDNIFTVGFDASFPPFGSLDEATGEYVGFDIDLAKEVAKRNDWVIKLQAIDWDYKDAELKSGAIDCIWNGFTINGREDLYTWSKPYVNNVQVVVVKADSGITKLADLAGKTVAVQADSSAETVLKNEQNQKMVELLASFKALDLQKDYITCFMNLQAGAADAVAMDVGVANDQIKKSEEGKYVILEEELAPEQYGIGFKLGNTELRDAVQATLDEMIADGTFMTIAEKYELQDSVITK